MNKLKTNGFILLIIFLFSCNNHNNNDIKSIYVLYYNYTFMATANINCDEIKKYSPTYNRMFVLGLKGDTINDVIDDHGVLDTTITDRKLLNEIKIELGKLKPDTSVISFDARVSCLITYYSGKKEHLCIGGQYPNALSYNGSHQKGNNKLVYLIKKNIQYYHWMGEENLVKQVELNDKFIVRDSIVNQYGFKW